MKYIIGVFFLIISVSLLGCAPKNNSTEDAEKVYNAVGGSIFSSAVSRLFDVNYFDSTGIVRESFGLYSKADTDILSSDLQVAAIIDTIEKNTQSSLILSGNISDKRNNDMLSVSGTAYYIMSGDKQYINRQSGSVGLGEGNAEGLLLKLILTNIAGQRLLIDDAGLINIDTIGFPQRKNITNILVSTRILMQSSGWVGFSAANEAGEYPLTIYDTGYISQYFKGLYNAIGLQYSQNPGIVFVGHVQTKDDPSIVIETMEDAYQDRILTGSIGIRHGFLSINTHTGNLHIQWQERTQSASVEIIYSQSGDDVVHLALTLLPRSIENSILGIGYNGTLEIKSELVGGNQNIITLPIAGLYTIRIVESTQFAEPVRYLLMSQVFGDAYGIGKLLENK